jgi:hypothetical protein
VAHRPPPCRSPELTGDALDRGVLAADLPGRPPSRPRDQHSARADQVRRMLNARPHRARDSRHREGRLRQISTTRMFKQDASTRRTTLPPDGGHVQAVETDGQVAVRTANVRVGHHDVGSSRPWRQVRKSSDHRAFPCPALTQRVGAPPSPHPQRRRAAYRHSHPLRRSDERSRPQRGKSGRLAAALLAASQAFEVKESRARGLTEPAPLRPCPSAEPVRTLDSSP